MITHAVIDGIIRITFCGERAKWLMIEGDELVTAMTPPGEDGEAAVWHDVIDRITCSECREQLSAAADLVS